LDNSLFLVLQAEFQAAFTRMKRTEDLNERAVWLCELGRVLNEMQATLYERGAPVTGPLPPVPGTT